MAEVTRRSKNQAKQNNASGDAVLRKACKESLAARDKWHCKQTAQHNSLPLVVEMTVAGVAGELGVPEQA